MFDFYNVFTSYFVHIFWALAAFLYVYSVYYEYFKIKKREEYLSDYDLINNYFLAKRKGLIK